MNKPERFYLIRIRHRSWYEWIIILIWLGIEIFLLQNAFSSYSENEPRAGFIFFLLCFLWLSAGLIVNFLRGTNSGHIDDPRS